MLLEKRLNDWKPHFFAGIRARDEWLHWRLEGVAFRESVKRLVGT